MEQEIITRPIKQAAKQVVVSTNHMPPVLRYVPKARCKEEEAPFSGFIIGNTGGKAINKDNGANLNTLKESITLPTQNIYQLKVSRPFLPRFVSYSKTLLDEEENLLNT